MGKAKKTRKFAAVKRLISSRDARLKKNEAPAEEKKDPNEIVREMYTPPSSPPTPTGGLLTLPAPAPKSPPHSFSNTTKRSAPPTPSSSTPTSSTSASKRSSS